MLTQSSCQGGLVGLAPTLPTVSNGVSAVTNRRHIKQLAAVMVVFLQKYKTAQHACEASQPKWASEAQEDTEKASVWSAWFERA